MRKEKAFLVKEVVAHVRKSDFLFLANFERMTVADVAELRASLAKAGAEYHVVKNSILNAAAKECQFPDLSQYLTGLNAVIVGGSAPTEVAKILSNFAKDKEKLGVKGGRLEDQLLSSSDVVALSKLPSLDVQRAQLLSLLNTAAQRFLFVLQGVPQGLLNVLQAKKDVA